MTRSMSRGKQQILFNYLPGKTFDFERGPIARISGIRGFPQSELNDTIIIRKIAAIARAWSADFRPALADHLLDDSSKFVVLDPVEADAEMFPRVFWCQNKKCGHVADYSTTERAIPAVCSKCRTGKLVQLRFVKVHRCGAIDALSPPTCPKCHGRELRLSDRESERLSSFRWVCMKCQHAFSLFGGKCRHCEWPAEQNPRLKDMDIEVHRAGRTYYSQTAVLLNVPRSELGGFLSRPDWECVVASKFLKMAGADEIKLTQLSTAQAESGVSTADLDKILDSGLTAEQAVEELRKARAAKLAAAKPDSDELCQRLSSETGIRREIWNAAGPELLEAIIPEEGRVAPTALSSTTLGGAQALSSQLGFEEIKLVPEYTIVNATFGYSRVEYRPDQCWLNPFPPDRAYQGRLPIFADRVQADAILVTLDPEAVLRWLSDNGIVSSLPNGSDRRLVSRAHFVRLFNEVSPYHTIGADQAELRMVFGLLHTLSHHCLKQASLLCGLERTSLSEYLIPRALTVAIYCNHRFGATIGALTALFEQALQQWLASLRDNRHCVYDPVCRDHDASCHACTHMSETSCRFFNLNLSRSFLFGGPDKELGRISRGFFDSRVGS